MELVMKNNMMHVEKISINKITKNGIIIPDTALAKFENNLPLKVLAVEEDNPVGIEIGDYVYPKGPHGIFTGRMENEEVTFMDIFNVLCVSKSFDPEKHTQVDYTPNLEAM